MAGGILAIVAMHMIERNDYFLESRTFVARGLSNRETHVDNRERLK